MAASSRTTLSLAFTAQLACPACLQRSATKHLINSFFHLINAHFPLSEHNSWISFCLVNLQPCAGNFPLHHMRRALPALNYRKLSTSDWVCETWTEGKVGKVCVWWGGMSMAMRWRVSGSRVKLIADLQFGFHLDPTQPSRAQHNTHPHTYTYSASERLTSISCVWYTLQVQAGLSIMNETCIARSISNVWAGL